MIIFREICVRNYLAGLDEFGSDERIGWWDDIAISVVRRLMNGDNPM